MDDSIPWIEKYRPQDLDDIILDDFTRKHIETMLLDVRRSHIIISGCPGIGKTTTVRCIARKILGEHYKEGYLELNSGENRGIRSISSIVPDFCKKAVSFSMTKVILFDEADNMVAKCQQEIIEMIKLYGHKTKFVFTCNDSTKLIEEIQSMSLIIRYKKLTSQQIKLFLHKICEEESLTYQKSGIDVICNMSDGDMRRAVNDLQKTAYTYPKITKKNVLNICNYPDPDDISEIIHDCLDLKIDDAIRKFQVLLEKGYFYLDILNNFVLVIVNDPNFSDQQKITMLDKVNQTKIYTSTGIRTELQLVAMLCQLAS